MKLTTELVLNINKKAKRRLLNLNNKNMARGDSDFGFTRQLFWIVVVIVIIISLIDYIFIN